MMAVPIAARCRNMECTGLVARGRGRGVLAWWHKGQVSTADGKGHTSGGGR